MGNTPSSTSTNTKPKLISDDQQKNFNIETALNKEVVSGITKMSNVIQKYNADDSNYLVNLVHSNTNKNGQIPEKILTNLTNFHAMILKNLEANRGTMNQEAFNANKKKVYADKPQLRNIVSSELTKQLNIDQKTLTDNYAILKNSPTAAKGVETIFKNINSIHSKYKYFEYEFINMNIFIIAFLQQTQITMNEFITKVIQISKERDEFREKVLSNMIDLLVNILAKSDLQIDPLEFDKINAMMINLQNQTVQQQKILEDKLKNAADTATNQLAPANPLNLRMGGKQKGGFIRSQMIFPDSFYAISSSCSS